MNLPIKNLCMNYIPCTRRLFEGVLNKVFNAVDKERKMKCGPDRVCAEWLLRNGASVKFKNQAEFLKDYNGLPKEDVHFRIVEVEAIESSISHYGFQNFEGCKEISKIKFHKCGFLEDDAIPELIVLKESLKHLHISSCPNLTNMGLLKLGSLNLTNLELYNLPYVKNKDSILESLKKDMPNCYITFE